MATSCWTVVKKMVHSHNRCAWHYINFLKRPTVNECLAEMLGTFILILFGCGSVAHHILSGSEPANALIVEAGFSVGLMLAVYLAGGISGGHVNPAVSLAMACLGKLKWKKVPFYCIAQFIGAFLGAAAVFVFYYEQIMYVSGTDLSLSKQIFASYQGADLSMLGGLFDQMMGTAMLVLGILAVTDQKNIGAPRGMEPFSIGLVLLGISESMGLNCGYPLNPARDLGPRIFTAVAGWGMEVFSTGNYWWWIPVVGPMIGGMIGAFVYQLVIHPGRKKKKKRNQNENQTQTDVLSG